MFESLLEVFRDHPDAWVTWIGLLGAAVGSFANVVAFRYPLGESVVLPGSFCRACNTPLRWWHNIPVVGWFLLRGRCGFCGARFSFRYPFVELLFALLFAFSAYRFGVSLYTFQVLIFVSLMVTACLIDVDHMLLPDVFTLGGLVIALLFAWLDPHRSFLDAVIGLFVGGGFLWAIAVLYFWFRQREGMGGGDIKLLAWIGAFFGWQAIPIVILVGSLTGSVVGIILSQMSQRADKDSSIAQFAIPFGPFLGLGALYYLYFDGAKIAQWYLDLHGL